MNFKYTIEEKVFHVQGDALDQSSPIQRVFNSNTSMNIHIEH